MFTAAAWFENLEDLLAALRRLLSLYNCKIIVYRITVFFLRRSKWLDWFIAGRKERWRQSMDLRHPFYDKLRLMNEWKDSHSTKHAQQKKHNLITKRIVNIQLNILLRDFSVYTQTIFNRLKMVLVWIRLKMVWQ